MAIGRAQREVNVGVFIAAALLLDMLLWLFVLLGWETVTIPANFASTHQPRFVFPYSHGLAAGMAWSIVAGLVAFTCYSRLRTRWRAGALVAAAVLSHWLLDALVHRPELPLVGTASPMVGLALWDRVPVALALEAILVAAGLYCFATHTPLPRSKVIGLGVLSVIAMIFTAVGMTVAPAPPSAIAMAAGSLGTLAVVCGLAVWLGMPRQAKP